MQSIILICLNTYCLNPPIVRIPEGKWYCPFGVAGISMIDVSEYTHVIAQHQGKKKNLAARAPKVDSSMIYMAELRSTVG